MKTMQWTWGRGSVLDSTSELDVEVFFFSVWNNALSHEGWSHTWCYTMQIAFDCSKVRSG